VDILAHGLWAGIGVTLLGRRIAIRRRTAMATVALAVLPDILQVLPVLGWVLAGDGTWATLRAWTFALPRQEPSLPPLVEDLSLHLYFIAHSAVIAASVTLLLWWRLRRFWIPLAGWWSHVAIDVCTHSADYYPVRVLYPFSDRGFDGWAWNQPWFLLLNYAALSLSLLALWWTRRR
jgi:hypothetical protein